MSPIIRTLLSYEDELHEVAILKTGCDDFGEPVYREGLRVLLHAFDTDLQLTESGWQSAYEEVLHVLIARLYTQKGWAEHPEVLSTPIYRPLIITGMSRTGTTALHKLLSVDPKFQGLEFWLTQTPMIRPPRESWNSLPQYRGCVDNLGARYARTPDALKIHEVVAGEVEECAQLLAQSFMPEHWAYLPTYGGWLLTQDALGAYLRYVDILRLIGGREPQKRWLLKNPAHMTCIDTLLKVFPDACIIQTHRDPLYAIPSTCSLLYNHRRRLEGEAARPEDLGPQWCAYWRKALDHMQAARQKCPTQFFDVDHRRFLADPLRIVRSIYEHFSLTLSPQTEERMRTWVEAKPTTRHGRHEYTLDSWGIACAQIRDTFADYRARYQFD